VTQTAEAIASRAKRESALRRAVPVSRMVDYGVPAAWAHQVHALSASPDGPDWDRACEDLADRARASVPAARAGARAAWREIAALLQCAQLAFSFDEPRKPALYEAAHEALRQHAALSDDLAEVELETPSGVLFGWRITPVGREPAGAVVAMGGLSGWGGAFLDQGRALARRGLLTVLAEAPGQGLTRLRSGLRHSAGNAALFDLFVDHALSHGGGPVGLWGNSFGGLLATRAALRDRRVRALCVNGAPPAPELPEFRTVRESMAAFFGATDEDALAEALASVAVNPDRDRFDGDVLVVEGGEDPLVPLGSQDAFLELTDEPRRTVLSWPDGEHTIYNHATERNERVADWFAAHLPDVRHPH
jgi:alpha-beta hydrolase superfamily lysophospholipase